VADDKKTQMGQTPARTQRPTGGQQATVVAASSTPIPAAAGTPAPTSAQVAISKAKTSYLPEAPDPLLGALIADRYKVIKKLGEGGMGAVYLAQHQVLEKNVALKVLHGEFARKPDLVERFMQEAKAASRIRHENVIDISDFGATPDGVVFFAMELLSGHDLHEEVARARLSGHLLPWSRTKKIFLQICSALTAAHARGIVHRDLKPENIYLVEFLGDPDFVKLLDFGIAKLTDVSTEEGGRKLTKTGMLFGTPEYMSPEQARGDQVDHRVDVYAMGCILFQLVTNRVPFEADNFMGVLSQHLTADPPQIAPETFDQIGAPRALTDVIDKALEKDRNRRWQTIEELANAVRQVSGDPSPADKPAHVRAANVAAPNQTTRARPPTNQIEPIRAEATGRIKTQWTGNLKVPEVAADETGAREKQKKSSLPLILGVLAVAGIGAVVAVMMLQKDPPATPPVTEPEGSAAVVTPPQPPPPQIPQEPPLPDMVTIKFESTPKGADVIDVSTNNTLGKTPYTFTVPGSKTPRQFKFRLKNYGDSTVELVPNRAEITHAQKLEKGATKPGNVVTKLPDSPTTTTAVTKPSDTTTTTKPTDVTTTKPDDKPEIKPVDVKPPDVKPPDVKPPTDDCPGDEPCLKVNIPGMGSASK
jgi:eukaryotic-like serine/threonine-protein kinase